MANVKKTILLVDDNRDVFDLLERQMEELEWPGKPTLLYMTHEQAITGPLDGHIGYIVDSGGREQNGHNICREIRRVNLTEPIIVFVSGYPTPRNRVQALESGANYVTETPYEPTEPLLAIRRMIHKI